MNRKYKIIIGILVLVSMFSTLPIANASQTHVADAEVVSVAHTPTIVTTGTNVAVSITFDNDAEVTDINLFYCSITPEYLCHLPIAMTPNGSDTWLGSFVVLEESGVIGYRMYVTTTMSSYYAPDVLNYLGYDNVIEPSTDTFYFSINLTLPTNQASLMSWCAATTSLFAVAVIRIKKRK